VALLLANQPGKRVQLRWRLTFEIPTRLASRAIRWKEPAGARAGGKNLASMTLAALEQNLRQSWRHLRRRPWAALVVIATLALAIGANTAIFTLVYGFLLRPFPFDGAGRLVRLRSMSTGVGQAGADMSVPDL
jgi:hypothetical protein